MKIRHKLLILLLAIALLPLVAIAVLHRVWMRQLGSELATGRREILITDAGRDLQRIVRDYGRILNRDKKALELALRVQAREIEAALAQPPPADATAFFSEDYDKGTNVPDDLAPSAMHLEKSTNSEMVRKKVSYDQQVYFLVAGTQRQPVDEDIRRLSTMPEAYYLLNRSNPELMYWQYTGLESGVFMSYPGHGGYIDSYDHRKRRWYTKARDTGVPIWIIYPEFSTKTVVLTITMPVRYPDGKFAGATAIDVPLMSVFKELQLPENWVEHAATMQVYPGEPGSKDEGKLVILAHRSYARYGEDWRQPIKLEYLESEDHKEFARMVTAMTAGKAGVYKLRYRGKEALWACGRFQKETPCSVVIVPYDLIVAKAIEAEEYVLKRTMESLKVTGGALLGVVAIVAAVTIISSRRVTRPVRELAEAAENLAGGDYDSTVDITTGDELQELGDVFNDMGPRLRENEKMKRSLALAMEIQQHLLPGGPPTLVNFDIAGTSKYSDETGGDYYDFIEVIEIGSDKLGIAVGDVTGHGIAAALLMASARAMLRSNTGRYGADLASLFAEINRHLAHDTDNMRFMTLFYGILDDSDRSLIWTSAGHDPALWYRFETRQIEEQPNTGLPLGVIDAAEFSQMGPVTIESGDVLLIGTDGIWEAQNPAGELFGKERLCEIIRARHGGSAEQIRTAVIDAVTDYRADSPQLDDITLVVIKSV